MSGWKLGAAVFLVVCSTLTAFADRAGGDWCEDCYQKSDGVWGPSPPPSGTSVQDARCCFSGSYGCDNLEAQDYYKERANESWCNTEWQDEGPEGYVCSGSGSGSCSSSGGPGGGGGEGGPGECTVQYGEVCPPSCMGCEYTF
jgi:hypothetical protein